MLQDRKRRFVIKRFQQAPPLASEIPPEASEATPGRAGRCLQSTSQELLRVRYVLDSGRWRKSKRVGPRRTSCDTAYGCLVEQKPGFGHSHRNQGKRRKIISNRRHSGSDFMLAQGRCLILGVSVDQYQVEVVVEREHSLESQFHLPTGRRIQATQIRRDYIDRVAEPVRDPHDVLTKRLVRRPIGQEQRACRHESVKEIWCSAGVVRYGRRSALPTALTPIPSARHAFRIGRRSRT